MAIERVPGGEQQHTTDDGQDGHGAVAGLPPGPEMMLCLWTSWVKSVSQLVSGESAVGEASRQISLDQITGGLLQGGVQQLGEMLAQDPNPARDRRGAQREPAAPGDPRGLDGDLPLASNGLAALPQPARQSDGRRRGVQYANVAVHAGDLERGGAALARAGAPRCLSRRCRQRQALCGSGVAEQPRLSDAEGTLPARLRLAAAPSERRGGHGSRRAPAPQLPSPSICRCDEPDPAPRLEPGGARREPGRRRAEPVARHRAR